MDNSPNLNENQTESDKNLPANQNTQKENRVVFGVLGKIFYSLSILMLIVSAFGIVSFVASAIVMLVGFTSILVTLGTIFLMVDGFWGKLQSAVNFTTRISDFIFRYYYLFTSLSIIFAVLAIIFLKLDKKRHTGCIVFSCVIIALSVVAIIIAVNRN